MFQNIDKLKTVTQNRGLIHGLLAGMGLSVCGLLGTFPLLRDPLLRDPCVLVPFIYLDGFV